MHKRLTGGSVKRRGRSFGEHSGDFPRPLSFNDFSSNFVSVDAENPFLWLWLKSQKMDQCFQLSSTRNLSLVKASVDQLLELVTLEECGTFFLMLQQGSPTVAPLLQVWKEEAFVRDFILTHSLYIDTGTLLKSLIAFVSLFFHSLVYPHLTLSTRLWHEATEREMDRNRPRDDDDTQNITYSHHFRNLSMEYVHRTTLKKLYFSTFSFFPPFISSFPPIPSFPSFPIPPISFICHTLILVIRISNFLKLMVYILSTDFINNHDLNKWVALFTFSFSLD